MRIIYFSMLVYIKIGISTLYSSWIPFEYFKRADKRSLISKTKIKNDK